MRRDRTKEEWGQEIKSRARQKPMRGNKRHSKGGGSKNTAAHVYTLALTDRQLTNAQNATAGHLVIQEQCLLAQLGRQEQ